MDTRVAVISIIVENPAFSTSSSLVLATATSSSDGESCRD